MSNFRTEPETSSLPPVDWRGLHFLLVEDNKDHQWLTAAVLRDTRVEVTIVERGEDAVELARSRPFDLILMDIRLPTMDGYETTRQLRAAGHTGPIVAITARAMDQEIEECRRAGCDACVSKPFDRATLRDTLTELLPRGVAGS